MSAADFANAMARSTGAGGRSVPCIYEDLEGEAQKDVKTTQKANSARKKGSACGSGWKKNPE